MSLDRVKTTVLEEARARAAEITANAKREADQILADGRAHDERVGGEAVRDARIRFERETVRELERIQHDNRLQILSAKNTAIDEVFRRIGDKLKAMSSDEYLGMVGKWLDALPADVGGELRVNPKDADVFKAGLDRLNKSRSGEGVFTSVATDPKVLSGAVVNGPDYTIDCTVERRIAELRETAAGELARVLFGA